MEDYFSDASTELHIPESRLEELNEILSSDEEDGKADDLSVVEENNSYVFNVSKLSFL